jgi:RNA polymerase sigma factor (sigma-70 family)
MERYIKEKDYKVQLIEKLIMEHGTELKRLAFLYVKDHSLAEDIIQEVFISCYNNLDNFREESSYKTWLTKITINKCKDTFKKWSFRNLLYKENIEINLTEHLTPEKQMIAKMEDILLAEQILILPIKFREVIILFYYEEFTLEEISSILKLNTNTVKTRLFRAKSKLRELMKGSETVWKGD